MLWKRGDMGPWIHQMAIMKEAVLDGKRYGITPDEAAVYDIAWMG